ncbi:MAG: site-specific integrase, partial [Pseudohongiellaceae bacterium]
FIENKYTEWVLSHHKRGDETLRLLRNSFSHLMTRPMHSINAWDMQKWRSEKTRSGLKASTINRKVATLKAVLSRAVEWEVIEVNPLQNIKPIRIDARSRIRYLLPDEEKRLRAALDAREDEMRIARQSADKWRQRRRYDTYGDFRGKFVDYLKPMVLLCLNTGMRRGEIFNLRWEDIEFAKKSLVVEGGGAKTGQTRHISMNSEVVSLLKQWRQQSQGELVFASPVTGERFDNIQNAWQQLLKKAGIDNFRFHDIRHTFASKLVMAGVDLYTVKELMGHSTIQMTEKYAHLAPEHKVSAVERLINSPIHMGKMPAV